jgi:hypothetical protein
VDGGTEANDTTSDDERIDLTKESFFFPITQAVGWTVQVIVHELNVISSQLTYFANLGLSLRRNRFKELK